MREDDKGLKELIGNTDIKRVRFLNTKDRGTQLARKFVHGMFYNKCPEYLRSFFTKTRDVHSLYTRGRCYNFQNPDINVITSTTFITMLLKIDISARRAKGDRE